MQIIRLVVLVLRTSIVTVLSTPAMKSPQVANLFFSVAVFHSEIVALCNVPPTYQFDGGIATVIWTLG